MSKEQQTMIKQKPKQKPKVPVLPEWDVFCRLPGVFVFGHYDNSSADFGPPDGLITQKTYEALRIFTAKEAD